MAYLITFDNKKIKIDPEADGRFTLREISNLLDGFVEPLFVGNWWIFKKYEADENQHNKIMSNKLNIEIYGDCMFVEEDLLEPCFFFPKELVQGVLKEIVDIEKQLLLYNTLDNDFENIPEEKKQEIIDTQNAKLFVKVYDELFTKNTPYDKLYKNFALVNNGINKIKLSQEKQSEFIELMILHFTKTEEFEKCKILKEYLDFITINN